MKKSLISPFVASALLALNVALIPSQVLAAGGPVVLDGNYASLLPNGVTSTIVHPIQGVTTEHYMGTGAWQSIPGGGTNTTNRSTFELYIDPTSALFSSLGAFTLDQVTSITYFTRKGTTQADVDFSLYFYTMPSPSCTLPSGSSWYCHRLTAEPMYSNGLNAPANTWNQWSTGGAVNQLVWYDAPRTFQGFSGGPTLANLQAGPVNWANYPSGSTGIVDYSHESVKYIKLATGSSWAGFTGYLDAINITLNNGHSLTLDLESLSALSVNPVSPRVAVGSDVAVNVNLASVTNLFGYQFMLHYDQTKLTAKSATFNNTFFDTATNAFIAWNADCTTPGVCKFSVTRQMSVGGEVNGSGPLAQVVFTGAAPGVSPITLDNDLLSDRNGSAIAHTTTNYAVLVYGFANVNGKVQLQGRATPMDTGTVTLTDAGGDFTPTVVTFDTTGAWTASVPVTLTNSTYNIVAAHYLYLSNQKTSAAMAAGGTFAQGTTLLKGGDANTSGLIDIGDLSCIAGDFGRAPTTCVGVSTSSDINADTTVNIYDLVLAGGNYQLTSPQGW